MTEHKLVLVKLSNCCCRSVKPSRYSTDTESVLSPLTLIGFYPSLNTDNDFQVYEQLLAVASRFLANNSQMFWSTTKSRKSCWPCDSCSTSTYQYMLSPQIKSASSQNYSGSSWPIRLLLGCGDEFKSPCSRILLERLWVWISTKLPTVLTDVLPGVIQSAEKCVSFQPCNLIHIYLTAFCSIQGLNLMWHKRKKKAFFFCCARRVGISENRRTVPHILKLVTAWRWAVSFTPRLLYPGV